MARKKKKVPPKPTLTTRQIREQKQKRLLSQEKRRATIAARKSKEAKRIQLAELIYNCAQDYIETVWGLDYDNKNGCLDCLVEGLQVRHTGLPIVNLSTIKTIPDYTPMAEAILTKEQAQSTFPMPIQAAIVSGFLDIVETETLSNRYAMDPNDPDDEIDLYDNFRYRIPMFLLRFPENLL